MISTKRNITEIEVALSKHFDYVKNVIAFNVYGLGESLSIWHECDMLILNKSGYLTEVEIKRSWEDFKNDFKKNHAHDNSGIIKYFYYCVPKSILQKAIEYFKENSDYEISGFISYDDDLNFETITVPYTNKKIRTYRKLFLEEQFQVARFGAMRAIKLKEKLIKEKKTEENLDGIIF